jgi:hypothetical protein
VRRGAGGVHWVDSGDTSEWDRADHNPRCAATVTVLLYGVFRWLHHIAVTKLSSTDS